MSIQSGRPGKSSVAPHSETYLKVKFREIKRFQVLIFERNLQSNVTLTISKVFQKRWLKFWLVFQEQIVSTSRSMIKDATNKLRRHYLNSLSYVIMMELLNGNIILQKEMLEYS